MLCAFFTSKFTNSKLASSPLGCGLPGVRSLPSLDPSPQRGEPVLLPVPAFSPAADKLSKSLGEFETYIRNNIEFIPNFGERYGQGETISIAFVESTINQVVSKRFVKKQQMQWTPRGAHFLLQIRTKVLNNDLEDVFRGWYPQFHARAA